MGCLADVGSTCIFEEVADCPVAGGGGGGGGSGTITGVTAGAGLTGGGTTGAVTLNVGAGTGITVNANDVAVDTTVIATKAYVDSSIAASGDITSVVAGAGLTGGGTTGAVTLDIGAGTGITVAADSIAVDTTVIATRSYVDTQDGTLVPKTRTLTAGAGLTGTGDLSADRTFDVGAGTGITVAADSVAVDQTFAPTWTGAHIFSTTDAGTTTVTRKKTDQHFSSGTPAAGFGVGQLWSLHSSANVARSAAQLDVTWIAATDTSETTQAALYLRGLNGLAAGNSALATLPTVAWSSETGQKNVLTDAVTNVVTDVLTLEHRTAGTAATNYGTGILFRGQDNANTAGGDDMGRLSFIWTNAGSGAENTRFLVQTRTTGVALATVVSMDTTNVTVSAVLTGASIGLNGNSLITSTSGATVTHNLSNSRTTHVYTRTAPASGSLGYFVWTSGNSTGQTASTEISNFVYSAHSRQWATGAITTQREWLINAPTYTGVGAMTITDAGTFVVSGAPIASTNMTITNPFSVWSQGGRIRLDGITVALGGGATALMGTIGGSGPATLTQNCWVEVTIDGTKTWMAGFR